jgi:hypothetical protein
MMYAQPTEQATESADAFIHELHQIVHENLRANTRLVKELQKGTLDLRYYLRADLVTQLVRRDNVAYHAAIVSNMAVLDVENGLRPKYSPELMKELLQLRAFQAGNASVEATGQFVRGAHSDKNWEFILDVARRVGLDIPKLEANRYNIEPWPEVVELAKVRWWAMKHSGNFVLGFARNFGDEEEHLLRDQAVYPAFKDKYGFEDSQLGFFIEHLKLEEGHSNWAERALRLFATTPELREQVRAFIRKNLGLHYKIWDLALEQPVKTRNGELVV